MLALAIAGCASAPALDKVPPDVGEAVCGVTPKTPAHDVAVAPHDRAGRAYVDDTIEVRVAVCGDPRPAPALPAPPGADTGGGAGS